MRSRSRLSITILLAGWALLASAPNFAADDKIFAEALREQRRLMTVEDGQLRGEGATWLIERAARAQFVLIGEDHGFADVPRFAQALQRGLGDRRFNHLVVEVGAHTTARIEHALRADPEGLVEINRRYPLSLPFLSLREDGELAASFVAALPEGRALWGVDQEFILSTTANLDALASRATTRAQRRVVARYREQALQADAAMRRAHSPEATVLTRWRARDFDALRAPFADDAAARELIDALDLSARIYREQNTAPYRSNASRSILMKREFMRQYDAALAAGEAPRVMFKLGAFHAGRGLSPTLQYDLGNLASELAQSRGGESLHLLVLATSGENNRHLAFSADDSDCAVTYDAAAELAVLDAAMLLDAAASDAVTVLDFTALRESGQPRPPKDSVLATLIHSYDAVVLIPHARAATNYP